MLNQISIGILNYGSVFCGGKRYCGFDPLRRKRKDRIIWIANREENLKNEIVFSFFE